MIKIALALALSTTAPLPVKTEKSVISEETAIFAAMIIATRTCGVTVSERFQVTVAAEAVSASGYDDGAEFARVVASGAAKATIEAVKEGRIVQLCGRLRLMFGGL